MPGLYLDELTVGQTFGHPMTESGGELGGARSLAAKPGRAGVRAGQSWGA